MKELLGKKWRELEEATRTGLLSKAAAVDGVTGNNKTAPGECIVDFFRNYIKHSGQGK